MTGHDMPVIHAGNVTQVTDVYAKRLVANVLTLIEGAVPTNSALKTSVKRAIWQTIRDMREELNSMTFVPERGQET